jgi:hypothetical protein
MGDNVSNQVLINSTSFKEIKNEKADSANNDSGPDRRGTGGNRTSVQ